MTLLNASDITMAFGERTLFSDVSFMISRGDMVGLVGRNGCGKTTLIKLITGELEPSKGFIIKKKQLRVGYLEQHVCSDSDSSAIEEALTVFGELQSIEEDLNKTELALLGAQTDELLKRQETLRERFISSGGLTYKSRTRSALLGLGLKENELQLPVSSLSGGQRSKIGLARLLLSEPELLLLDEPTNHLDIESIEWLEEYLMSFPGAAIIISHDRYFLDRVTNKTFEMKNGRIHSSNGNYSRHLRLEAERQLTLTREYEKNIKEIKRIEGIIAQQKTFSMERNYRTIEHKQKSIDRIRENLVAPEKQEKGVHFRFTADDGSGNDVLKAEGLTKCYGDRVLFRDISLDIKRQEHVFLLGPNGSGKTTLLREILKGEGVKFGARVTVGYFDQLQATLNPENTLLDELHNEYPHLGDTTVRSALAAFLFTGDEVYSKIGDLSGGERARVALCKLMLSGNNLLFLDEPTNHLDLRSREALENALLGFDGTIIAVSHDRYFINKLATRIMYLEKGELTDYIGNYEDFIERRKGLESISEASEPKKQMGEGGKEYNQKKLRRREKQKLITEVKRLEETISDTESRISDIEKQLSLEEVMTDYQKTLELSSSLDELNESLLDCMERWEEKQNALKEMEETE